MLGLNKHISVTFFHKTCKQLAEAASVSVKKRKGISSIIVLCPSQIFLIFLFKLRACEKFGYGVCQWLRKHILLAFLILV